MKLDAYQCLVRVKTCSGPVTQTVQLYADSYWSARVQLEAQYGRDNLISSPQKVS
jgi:hypothetical protein